MIANDIEYAVREKLPNVTVTVAEPALPAGFWHVDFVLGARAASVQVEAPGQIGVTALPAEYGCEAEEYFEDPEAAASRVVELLSSTERGTLGRLVQRLRSAAGRSQAELAAALGMRQPAVSKLERRDDVTLAMLYDVADLVGATVTITFELPGQRITLHHSPSVSGARGAGTDR
jgi:hypothetical protein